MEKQSRVLVVDDSLIVRKVHQGYLEKIGLLVDTAENGIDGFALIQNNSQSYAALLIDIDMPGINGYDVARKVRRLNEHYKQIPIIAITTNIYENCKNLAIDAGMSEVIKKPVLESDFVSIINMWLGL